MPGKPSFGMTVTKIIRILAMHEPKNSKNVQPLDVQPDNSVNRPSLKSMNNTFLLNRP